MTRQRERGLRIPNLRAWRRYKLISQPELALMAGLTRSAISRLETHDGATANIETIGKLAKALDISRDQLVRLAPPTEEDSGAA